MYGPAGCSSSNEPNACPFDGTPKSCSNSPLLSADRALQEIPLSWRCLTGKTLRFLTLTGLLPAHTSSPILTKPRPSAAIAATLPGSPASMASGSSITPPPWPRYPRPSLMRRSTSLRGQTSPSRATGNSKATAILTTRTSNTLSRSIHPASPPRIPPAATAAISGSTRLGMANRSLSASRVSIPPFISGSMVNRSASPRAAASRPSSISPIASGPAATPSPSR